MKQQQSICKTCQICIESEQTITAQMNSYKPRGSLARILYERQIADNYLNKIDKNEVRFIHLFPIEIVYCIFV